jgi:hypothetical protein
MLNKGYLVRWPWLSIYLYGWYCDVEIDIRFNGITYTHQFFTRDGFYNHFSNKHVYKVSDLKPRGNNVDTFI